MKCVRAGCCDRAAGCIDRSGRVTENDDTGAAAAAGDAIIAGAATTTSSICRTGSWSCRTINRIAAATISADRCGNARCFGAVTALNSATTTASIINRTSTDG